MIENEAVDNSVRPTDEQVEQAITGGWNAEPTQQIKEQTEQTEQAKVEVPQQPDVTRPPVTEATEQDTVQDKFGGEYGKLKKSYDEGIQWNTRQAQDIAELRRELASLKETRQDGKSQQRQMTWEEVESWKERDPEGYSKWYTQQVTAQQIDPVRQEISSMRNMLNDVVGESKVNSFRARYPDFKELEGDMKSVVAGMPQNMITDPKYYNQALETAYWAAKGRRGVQTQKAEASARQRATTQKTQAKSNAYVEGSGKTSPEQPFNYSKANAEEIKKYLTALGQVREE